MSVLFQLRHFLKYRLFWIAFSFIFITVFASTDNAGMEAIYTQGIWMAESLQQRTINYQNLWLIVTHIGDPKAAFLLVFPFTYFFSRRAGVAVVWVAAISEWLNLVFKW